ncbi:vitamin H transporter Vth1 [Schizosaccharomyces japonicus yFS275]|uniref:Vitamin H transporter Vth1 n=1 Tax=Schizosaccharomyces japonicus (strain yFS275 / FY16936) TaxID=402676 RepID=B6K157_SCHJY|nr:vitamin H transporter Vth1 [Schizosaccharomyces japonicus yFS275]EEB07678.1 vitamin H transporter Vth1 [Schizosaccharomyces japonicus yFS275]
MIDETRNRLSLEAYETNVKPDTDKNQGVVSLTEKAIDLEKNNDQEVTPSSLEEEFTHDEMKNLQRIRLLIDLRVIPCLWILYFLSCCIRFSVSLAFTMNTTAGHSLLQTLPGINAHYTSLGLALFYVAYVVFEVPSNLVMTLIDPRIWMARIQVSIGVIGACHAILGSKHSSAQGFVCLRFFLGVAESGLWPGLAYYMSRWYRGEHLGKRIGWYYTAAQIAAAAVSLISAGFQRIDMNGGLYGYQWMFLVWGVITIAQGILVAWWLPAVKSRFSEKKLFSRFVPDFLKRFSPSRTPFLKDADKQLHTRYISGMLYGRKWSWRDLIASLLDLRLWPFIVMYFGVVGVGNGIFGYCTLIVRQINPKFSSISVSLLTAPIWLCDALSIVLVMPLYDRFRNKMSFFCSSCVVIIVGLVVATYAHGVWARYVGLLLIGFGLGPTVPICTSWASEVMSETYGDVGVASALALVSGLGNLGSVLTTYALYSGWSSDPTYRKSNDVCIGLIGISIVSCVIERLLLSFGPNRYRSTNHKSIKPKEGMSMNE